ncbi:hypothetical protein F5B18DRAFT_638865 [Nemania serpens]|nr:hypothetical protein F5B18DRAFT_638865 [Nemania serpens]
MRTRTADRRSSSSVLTIAATGLTHGSLSLSLSLVIRQSDFWIRVQACLPLLSFLALYCHQTTRTEREKKKKGSYTFPYRPFRS